MEEIQNTMRDNQYKLNRLGKSRAMEKQLRHPQLMDNNMLEPTTDAVIHGKGGGDAGLARVVGSGKHRGRPRKVTGGAAPEEGPKQLARKLLQQLRTIHGGAFVAEFRSGMDSESDEEEAPKRRRGGAAPMSAPPQGLEVGHAMMSVPFQKSQAVGQQVPPGGLAPRAYGSAPQAPASFARNSVTLGAQPVLPSAQVGNGRCGRGRPRKVKGGMDERPSSAITPSGSVLTKDPGVLPTKTPLVKPKPVRARLPSPPPAQTNTTQKLLQRGPPPTPKKGGRVAPAGAGKKSSARGQMISKIMKEKGLTLGQASKYLKEHGSA
jgi:hypothetical protein